jgi:hypothetical protein
VPRAGACLSDRHHGTLATSRSKPLGEPSVLAACLCDPVAGGASMKGAAGSRDFARLRSGLCFVWRSEQPPSAGSRGMRAQPHDSLGADARLFFCFPSERVAAHGLCRGLFGPAAAGTRRVMRPNIILTVAEGPTTRKGRGRRELSGFPLESIPRASGGPLDSRLRGNDYVGDNALSKAAASRRTPNVRALRQPPRQSRDGGNPFALAPVSDRRLFLLTSDSRLLTPVFFLASCDCPLGTSC